MATRMAKMKRVKEFSRASKIIVLYMYGTCGLHYMYRSEVQQFINQHPLGDKLSATLQYLIDSKFIAVHHDQIALRPVKVINSCIVEQGE
jgi:hypothetical protein